MFFIWLAKNPPWKKKYFKLLLLTSFWSFFYNKTVASGVIEFEIRYPDEQAANV